MNDSQNSRDTQSQPRATNLREFLTHVQEIHSAWEIEDDSWLDPWFRGTSNATYSLLPGFYRPAVIEARKKYELEEDDYRTEFELKATPYLRDMQAESPWEKYCLMQHYGLPTRLLDWSESALIALYFAVGAEMPSTADAAVWMLDPWWFNKVTVKDDNLFFTWEKKTQSYLPPLFSNAAMPQLPMAIQAAYNSPRISAQRGLFTVHGKKEEGLEILCNSRRKTRLVKIVIEQSSICAVRRQLRTAGITATSVYPDLAGLCAELRQDWSDLPDIEGAVEPAKTIRRIPPRKSGRTQRLKRWS